MEEKQNHQRHSVKRNAPESSQLPGQLPLHLERQFTLSEEAYPGHKKRKTAASDSDSSDSDSTSNSSDNSSTSDDDAPALNRCDSDAKTEPTYSQPDEEAAAEEVAPEPASQEAPPQSNTPNANAFFQPAQAPHRNIRLNSESEIDLPVEEGEADEADEADTQSTHSPSPIV